jgi:hypothetical protein
LGKIIFSPLHSASLLTSSAKWGRCATWDEPKPPGNPVPDDVRRLAECKGEKIIFPKAISKPDDKGERKPN